MEEHLKECPFCGKTAEYFDHPPQVYCKSCNISIEGECKESAIEIWNTRPATPLVGVDEKLTYNEFFHIIEEIIDTHIKYFVKENCPMNQAEGIYHETCIKEGYQAILAKFGSPQKALDDSLRLPLIKKCREFIQKENPEAEGLSLLKPIKQFIDYLYDTYAISNPPSPELEKVLKEFDEEFLMQFDIGERMEIKDFIRTHWPKPSVKWPDKKLLDNIAMDRKWLGWNEAIDACKAAVEAAERTTP